MATERMDKNLPVAKGTYSDIKDKKYYKMHIYLEYFF